MNGFKKFYCRTFQFIFKMALPFLPYREPKILQSNLELVDVLKSKRKKHVFLVTDEVIRGLGLTKALEDEVTKAKLGLTVFDKVKPNPTVALVEEGLKEYLKNKCDCIVCLGGGSVIDCAKTIGARAVKPNQSVQSMKGLLKVGKKLPLLIAIPTTAGTGSETTLAAVITDERTHHKYPINDFNLIPHYALLDPNLIVGLNKFITATTGMDALTHAVEAYIGRSTTRRTRKASLDAIKLIYENLVKSYNEPTNLQARSNMLKASYLAGVAFTKSYVGYVHAIAHSLGGEYGIPHGYANAVILPVMLKEYGHIIDKKLAKISKYIGFANKGQSDKELAAEFIKRIEDRLNYFGISDGFAEIKVDDIAKLAKLADKEANPLYPVPKLMDSSELEKIYYLLKRG